MPLFDMLIHTNKLTCSGPKDSIEGEDNTIHGPVADVGDDDDEGAAPGTRVLATVKLAKTLRK